ncbi:hypothetical protein C488_12196 [Natrinema pellirubrum DSM 15624]|uniref:Uncharacterized protein n=1 Tax=Natrinema pellirubrum (strain DSM 15624 / CIP 106293 / JCM 10476 / NCIMB 786 / 157) TaxID=797303 RepID=L0JNM2_NATP1|nr:hypothetical protein [Natrinema pellirubrum]AGB32423.1 hypothetical protein Natpe_2615 [Natrinema pellirubrum DSM 15624]ELY73912.1 hypothetical protein C488_12196 [Natrinema pellirubrum DSM 15624]
MQDRDRVSLTALRRSVAAARGRAIRAASRLPGAGTAGRLGRLWQRHVRGRPDQYQASITFPTGPDRPDIGEIQDWIEALEYAFEGRLDVYARRGRIAVETDPVSAELFDLEAFDAICERIADGYGGSHSLAHVRKWRRNEGQLVRAHVIVPVKPLFPRDEGANAEPAATAPAVGAD